MSKEKPLQYRFHDPLLATDAFLSPSPKTKKTKDKEETFHQRYFPIFPSFIEYGRRLPTARITIIVITTTADSMENPPIFDIYFSM
jgi:hypothetical protein